MMIIIKTNSKSKTKRMLYNQSNKCENLVHEPHGIEYMYAFKSYWKTFLQVFKKSTYAGD
ncbi:GSCOCG00002188001-RA-CDS [Cotesia congregata]|nr:GSCOCG00002188001-RA-CDS [Cotesia congregata]